MSYATRIYGREGDGWTVGDYGYNGYKGYKGRYLTTGMALCEISTEDLIYRIKYGYGIVKRKLRESDGKLTSDIMWYVHDVYVCGEVIDHRHYYLKKLDYDAYEMVNEVQRIRRTWGK